MAEKLRIKGRDQERLRVHDVVQVRELQSATLQIVTRMAPHLLSGPLRLVGLFGLERGTVIGDGVQFESEGPGLVQPERFQLSSGGMKSHSALARSGRRRSSWARSLPLPKATSSIGGPSGCFHQAASWRA